MSPRTMRILVVNVCVLLVAFSVTGDPTSGSMPVPMDPSAGTGTPTPVTAAGSVSAVYGLFLEHGNNSKILLELMKQHFDLSLEYLLTSKQYGSQFVQRPGMAKLLGEASNRQWEEGMNILKKFLQRGGSISIQNFIPSLTVGGSADLPTVSSEAMKTEYVNTLKEMLEDSKDLTKSMNNLHHLAGKISSKGGDAEIAHYFDSKLEKEAEITRDLAGHINTLQKMNKVGIALNMFDSNI